MYRFHRITSTTVGSLFRCLPVAWCLLLALTVTVAAQEKRQLDHSDYDRWNSVGASQISNDGKWISYSISSAKPESESVLHVRQNGSDKEYKIPRASGARFTFDSRYLIYRVPPAAARIKELKKANVKSEELPDTQLEMLELATGQRMGADGAISFNLPAENGRWVAFLRKATSDEKLEQTKSDVNETLNVTEQGLQRPEKKVKLKPRRTEPFAMPEPKGSEAKSKEEAKAKAKPEKESQSEENSADEKPDHKKKSTGNMLVLHDLDSGLQRTYPNVVRYSFDKHGTRLAMVTSVVADTSKLKSKKSDQNADDKQAKDKKEGAADDSDPAANEGVHVIDLSNLQLQAILTGVGEYRQMSFNEDGTRLAILTNKDSYLKKSPSWSVYHWKAGQKQAELAVEENTAGIPQGWWISPGASLTYSEDNQRLYFDTAPVPEDVAKQRKEAADKKAGKEPAEEKPKAKLDLWHWQDPQLQPQQLLRAEVERRRDYRAAFQLKSKQVHQLATKAIPDLRIDPRSPANVAVASSDVPFQKMLSWDIPGFENTYLINLNTGDHELILEKSKASRQQLSPEGKYVTWYDPEQQHWFAMATSDKDRQPVNISGALKMPLYDELHDTPSLPGSYGSPGWLKDDQGFLIYDRYDIWKLDPSGEAEPVCLTAEQGREQKIRFRAMQLDREARAFDPEQPIYLTAFNETTKADGFYRLALSEKAADVGKVSKEATDAKTSTPSLTRLIMVDESLGRLNKARDTDDVLFTRSTFQMYPDLWTSTLKFEKIHRVSHANPQQKDYLWGSAELVTWESASGEPLEGLLYKPEGFDPEKKYPMMVYFYERNSDNLHRYYAPEAGRSIINFSFYVSRGYVLFVPDIPYRTGEPGPSAADAILPGVESLLEQGFVDKDKVGMQGHSWGGYQTAYLVTQTDMFACAESGAPVSNMTSAYGGIRWGSGMSRMFQYEKTQSRIGGDLWTARDKYIANSPVFFADKVNTPLLILHNDEDGAVPWYQGIEMFVALRRLEKPAWLLNYNGDPHWVMSDANRRDFAKRMQQFFDHYLMDAPEPEWMAYGVPAVDKGKEFGFDLLEPKQPAGGEEKSESEAESSEPSK